MNTRSHSFPAKILLFGEYTILLGSSALSIPYWAYDAKLDFPVNEEATSSRHPVMSNHRLLEFCQYLKVHADHFSKIIDLERFEQDLGRGLFLRSTIPSGYGLGSSGALVAAVYEKYSRRSHSMEEIPGDEEMFRLKLNLSELESFFHGKSSGFDPTACFLKRPLFLRSGGIPGPANLPGSFSAGGQGIFLLDTGQPGKTSPLVKTFLDRFKPEGRVTDDGMALAGLTNSVLNSFLECSDDIFWDLMRQLSHNQMLEFKAMIPDKMISVWSEGIDSGLFYLKLCGSGGGGFLTGFARDIKMAGTYLERSGQNLIAVPI
jgi:mevalonate kinase